MNKRIKTMWEEATGSVWPCHGKLTAGESEDNLKKFAELIIQDILKEIYDDVQYITDFDTADHLVTSVEKHFGVTE